MANRAAAASAQYHQHQDQQTINDPQQQQQVNNNFLNDYQETDPINESNAISSFVEIVNNVIRSNGSVYPMSEKTALKFLNARKFDVTRAIELYQAHEITRLREGLAFIDINDEHLKAELESRKFTILKCHDETQNDTTIAIFTAKLHQPDKTNKNHQVRQAIHRYTLQGIVYQLDAALEDIVTQRNGIVFIYDMNESDMSNFDFELCEKILYLLKGAYPARLKRIFVIGSPIWFKFAFQVLSVIVKKKLRERVEFVSLGQLHKYLGVEHLLPEHGGSYQHDHKAWLRECEMLYKTRMDDLCDPNFAQTLTNQQNNGILNSTSNQNLLIDFASSSIINNDTTRNSSSTSSSTNDNTHSANKKANFDNNNNTNKRSNVGSSQSSRPTINLKKIYQQAGFSGQPNLSSFANDSHNQQNKQQQQQQQVSKNNHQQLQATGNNSVDSGNTIEPQRYDYDDSGLSLSQFIEKIKTLGHAGLGDEYETIIDNERIGTFQICTSHQNMNKNRYVNIKCYDHSRVILEDYDIMEAHKDRLTDYINANYVDGYRQARAYISTQGPTSGTLIDFWRMIWQTNSRVIAMVTLNVENYTLKCDKYWPTKDDRLIIAGYYTIEHVNQEHCEDHIITQLKLTNNKLKKSRTIWHTQFISWPDFGTPQTATALLRYRENVLKKQRDSIELAKKEEKEEDLKDDGESAAATAVAASEAGNESNDLRKYPPIVVHCSAGVGRSGTFITIDICLQKLDTTGLVDINGVVEKLREQRYLSIQTREQYVFCYKSVLEYSINQGLLEEEAGSAQEVLDDCL